MSTVEIDTELAYPESDGQPMGETDLHIDWILRIRDMLKQRYKGQRVYVASDLFLYYVKGSPSRCVVPDGLVVKDCDPGRRRTFKTWEEERVPNVVFEITSASTEREDTVNKPMKYAAIGVAEYFLYDPSGEYLDPCLQGYRLDADGEYSPITPCEDGSLVCEQLGISLGLSGLELVLRDLVTGLPVQTEGEAEQAARELAEGARDTANKARDTAEAAREVAEAEVERLRDRLRQLGDDLS